MPLSVYRRPFVIHVPPGFVAANPHLRLAAADLARAYANQVAVSDAALRQIGTALWNALAAADPTLPAALDEARAAAGNRILRLIIDGADPDARALPWEALHPGAHGFPARAETFTLSRRAAGRAPDFDPPEPGPLRVLMFTCLPDDLDPVRSRLDVETQQALALQSLGPAISAGRVWLEMPDDGRFGAFRSILRDVRPHLVFLFTHGRFHNEPGQTEKPYATALFETDDGRSHPVRDTDLAAAFTGVDSVRGLVLAACETGKGDSRELIDGLAGALRAIPHVVGMRESILETAAMRFNAAFGAAVAAGEAVDVALQAGRAAAAALGERGRGNWTLPALFSHDPALPLVDWDLPRPAAETPAGDAGDIGLSARFIGRRSELRQLKGPLLRGERPVLLLTGPGGQGKTMLAARIAADWRAGGGAAAGWTARQDGGAPWEGFRAKLAEAAGPEAAVAGDADEQTRAAALLRGLLRAHGGRYLLFLDNLEDVQDPDTLEWTRPDVAAFVAAARDVAGRGEGLRLLLTSRERPPGWPDAAHHQLERPDFGDFVRMAIEERAPATFWGEGWPDRDDRPRSVYAALNGNGRGLNWLVGAIAAMTDVEEAAFLAQLERTAEALRVNMTLDALLERLDPAARALLDRLPAYDVPVPREGLLKLGLDLPDPDRLLQRLLDVSLVERFADRDWAVDAFAVSALVAGRPAARPGHALDPARLRAAADYQQWLFEHERPTVGQAIILHRALLRAGERAAADRLALRDILRPLDRAGLYRTLLEEWLPGLRESADDRTRSAGLDWSGNCHLTLGEYDLALPYFEQSLAISRQIGDRAGEGTTLNNMATAAHARGDYDTALDYLQQSLAIRRQIGDRAGEGTTLNNISQIYDARGDYDTALTFLQQSLAIQRDIGDRAGEGTTLNNMATAAHARGDYDTALDYLQQSLAIQRDIGDRAGEGTTLNNISQIFKARGDYDTALTCLQQSLAIRRQIGDRAGEGTTLNNISQIYDARGDYDTALDYLQQSLAIRRQIGDRAGEGTTLNNISQIYDARGDYDTALTFLQQSLAIQRDIGDRAGEGTTLNNMATAAHARGDYDTALDYLQQSLAIRRQIGDRAGEGTTLNNISQIYDARGDYDTALTFLQQSLAIRRQIGDRAGEGTTLNNMATAAHARGDYDTALDYLQQSLAIQRDIGDRAGEGTTLNNISQIFKARGDYDTALTCLQQSLAIRRQIGDRAGEGTTLNNISQIYDARGDYDTALDYLQQSLAIRRQIGDRAGEGTTLNNISQIYDARGDYDTALDYLQQSLAIRRQIGDRAGEGTTLNNISQIYDARGDYDTALTFLQQSLAIQRDIGDRAGEGTTLNNMATAAHARGDYDTALTFLQQSLAIQRDIGDRAGEGATLNNISQIFKARGDYDTALTFLQQSLAIRRQIGDRAGEGATLNNMATAAHARGDYDTALTCLQQSLAIQQDIGDRAGEGTTLNNMATAALARGDYDTALTCLQQSLAIRRQIGDARGLCATLFNMGHIHAQNEQQGEALGAWVAAYRIADRIGWAEALQNLERLAGQIGLPGGLASWAALAERMGGGDGGG